MSKFNIPKSAYEGFDDLIEMGPEKLEQLTREVANRDLTLDTSALAKKLASAIKFPIDQVERALYAVLVPLNSLRAAFGMEPSDFLSLLADLIESQNKNWHEAHSEEWGQVAQKLEPLLTQNGYFALLSKTFQLLANRPMLVREFKLLTELRPVYDDDITTTKAMVLTNTLVVDYEEAGALKCLHVTVNRSDLRALQVQLDRAERKVQLLEEQAGRLGVPVLVAGTEQE